MFMMFGRPKCALRVKQGERRKWRWTARSVGFQDVSGAVYENNEVVALSVVQGEDHYKTAQNKGLAATRGWNVIHMYIEDRSGERVDIT